MSWAALSPGSSARTFSGVTATDASRQFVGIGPIAQGNDVDFVLSIDEERILYLAEGAPYLLLQEVMETP